MPRPAIIHAPAFLPHMEIILEEEPFRWVVAQHSDTHCHQPSGRHLAVSLLSTFK
jgi:hypothetical protein